MATKYHARSISLPSRSHPSTVKVEEELRKMKKWESSSSSYSSSVCGALLGLQELYDSIDELLKMGSTQQVLARSENRQLVDELLDGSMKLLDICSLAKEMTLETQVHVGALFSAVRRRKGDSAVQTAVAAYTCFRKKMKKEAKKLITSMRKMDEKLNSLTPLVNLDHHLSSVIGALRQACSTNSSIFESVFLYLTPLMKPEARGWSLVSKWVHKGAIACELNSGMNEFENVDAALRSVEEVVEIEKLQIAQRRLEGLEMAAQDIESGLDGVFRRLIRTRASLLNIISQ
ncbi:uncharacterized protein LOC111005532 [Momordica charantia]|uniref:Uncharacterized protein LOC111005532 n=1 Tax=Momordica charantia TaxID=3673 RepID=A0A6J1BTB3_MOMCH|nr:uncharacterized protein LOC111005532 [Momordica charantia]